MGLGCILVKPTTKLTPAAISPQGNGTATLSPQRLPLQIDEACANPHKWPKSRVQGQEWLPAREWSRPPTIQERKRRRIAHPKFENMRSVTNAGIWLRPLDGIFRSTDGPFVHVNRNGSGPGKREWFARQASTMPERDTGALDCPGLLVVGESCTDNEVQDGGRRQSCRQRHNDEHREQDR
jgi:hypothetical protein